MLRWLHISDLHLNSKGASTAMLRDELPRYLREQGMRCDYVFCTGDIRTANEKPNDYTDDMADFLREVCDAVGTTTERLFIVPGNHDIDRDNTQRMAAIRKVKYQPEWVGNYDAESGLIDRKDMAAILKGETKFIKFLGKIYPKDRLSYYGNKDAPHFNIETEDFNILHVDTTLVYAKNQEKTDLIVGTSALYEAVRNLNPGKPTILLTHYPFTALAQDEKKILSTMLQKHEVRLWLAGHEHDHVLQKMHYLDSLQAGELRVENKANASFLIGEYNQMTGVCKVCAYTWFPEGWAKYPIVDLDGRKEDTYECRLKPLGGAVMSSKARATQAANKEYSYRLPKKVEKNLLPAILDDDVITNLEELLTDAWPSDTPHVILLADGGMGKTTMLLDYCRSKSAPILYLPAERLATLGVELEQYIVDKVYDGDADRFRETLSSKYSEPNLTLFVDGLNEVDADTEGRYVRELQRLSLLKGLQIVVTSRSNFTFRHSMPGYKHVALCPLEDKQIRGYFTDKEWRQIQNSGSLHQLLQNPMLVTVYKEICSVIDEFKDVEFLDWILPVRHATDLFHNYYVAQLALMMKRAGIEGERILFASVCIRDILPAVAYAYENAHSLNQSNAQFRDMLQGVLQNLDVDSKSLIPIQERYRLKEIPVVDSLSVTELLIDDLRLLYRDNKTTSFPHQMFRDYLSAQWIIRQSSKPEQIDSLWNRRAIPLPIMRHIRQGSGAYWKNGLANAVKKEGEGKLMDNAGLLVDNLLQCFPYTPDSGIPDYSGLYLSGHLLSSHQMKEAGQVNLNGATIDSRTLGLVSGDTQRFVHLCLSHDHAFLAAVDESRERVMIFSLFGDVALFVHELRKRIVQMEFHGNRLYVLAGSLFVFSFDGVGWGFTGEIQHKDGDVTHKLKSIIESEWKLYLYYNNRLVIYDLADCHKIKAVNGKLWEAPIEGADLTLLKQIKYPIPNLARKQTDVLCEVGDENYKAVSYGDGRLAIMSGTELLGVLKRGKTLLMDAAISGDGRRAATLSYKVFGNKRKIQLWDLDKVTKVADLYCPEEVNSVHLSETGGWVLGENKAATWVLNVQTGEEAWYNEHFVSNHAGRLVTYGTQVVKRNGADLLLLDLENQEEKALECPYPNPSLVCFLPDGTLAAVNDTGKSLRFKSTRDERTLTIIPDGQRIISVQALKGQPFIAVFTVDRRIRLYHTGNQQCLRNEAGHSIAKILVVHPSETLMADSDGYRSLETRNYFEKKVAKRRMGWWYDNPYQSEDHAIDGDILDIAFNAHNKQLVAFLANGRIVFCDEKYCCYQDSISAIIAFDVSAYNFKGCICSDELKGHLRRNGATL